MFAEVYRMRQSVCVYRLNRRKTSGTICTICLYIIPVVPHKAVAEVSKIGNL